MIEVSRSRFRLHPNKHMEGREIKGLPTAVMAMTRFWFFDVCVRDFWEFSHAVTFMMV
jgi:hypothetical protein